MHAVQTVSMEMLLEMLEAAHEPTTQRMNRVEESNKYASARAEACKTYCEWKRFVCKLDKHCAAKCTGKLTAANTA